MFLGNNISHTQKFSGIDKNKSSKIRNELEKVYKALAEKGYNPVSQIVGYILSGDPTYVTAHANARNIISKFENDEILEELVNFYFKENKI